MSEIDKDSFTEMPADVDTPQVPERERVMPGAARVAAKEVADPEEEEEEFEDASDAGEVFFAVALVLICHRR